MSEKRNETALPLGATLGQLRELTFDLPDDTPIAVVIRKAHDPDFFYEEVMCEAEPSVDLTNRVVVLTAPEPRDVDW